MRVKKIGKVTHGVTISRIVAKSNEEYEKFELITMQDLSREIDKFNLKEEKQYILVSKKKFNKDMLAKKEMILVGLTSHKAMVIGEMYVNKIIPSNFAYIDVDNTKINPMYFTWYFNEHPNIQKQLQIAIQGSSIRALSVQMLRELEISVPSLEVQEKIGKIYELRKKKQKLSFEKTNLENKLYKHMLIEKLKEA